MGDVVGATGPVRKRKRWAVRSEVDEEVDATIGFYKEVLKMDFREQRDVDEVLERLGSYTGDEEEGQIERDWLRFDSVLQYRKYFEILLFEDLRAELRQALKDLRGNSTGCWMVVARAQLDEVTKLDPAMVTISVVCRGTLDAVLSAQDICWLQLPRATDYVGMLAVVDHVGARRDEGYVVTLRIMPATSDIAGDVSEGLELLRKSSGKLFALGSLVTRFREFEALATLQDHPLISFVLDPEEFRRKGSPALVNALRERLPTEFLGRVQVALNASQFQAVCRALEFKDPILLIQGPPGTGKTYTTIKLLNALHLAMFQQRYDSLFQVHFKRRHGPTPTMDASLQNSGQLAEHSLDDILGLVDKSDAHVKAHELKVTPRPRILVCAPSNTAVDEILSRLAIEKLIDANGAAYSPTIVRIGATQRISKDLARTHCLDSYVDAFMAYTKEQLKERIEIMSRHCRRVNHDLKQFRMALDRTEDQAARFQIAQNLIAASEELHRANVEIERCTIAEAGQWNVRELLQITFLREAQIVFGTLSGCASRMMRAASRSAPFHLCIVDEAAQCVEPTLLTPLALGVKWMALVGDARQLPATVFMQNRAAELYERSLFERLEKNGCDVHMLQIQFRMHPEIAKFPSSYFYQGRVQNSESVMSESYCKPYHKDELFRPYVFFDLSDTREARSIEGNSLYNPGEARFIVRHLLRLHQKHGNETPNVLDSVAILTPYREQKRFFEKTIKSHTPEQRELLQNVRISTVDAFQGQESDIVILSCVRARQGGSIGFVQDVRRLNVAITRPRHSLWIVGNAQQLGRFEIWRELLRDAEERQCLHRGPDKASKNGPRRKKKSPAKSNASKQQA